MEQPKTKNHHFVPQLHQEHFVDLSITNGRYMWRYSCRDQDASPRRSAVRTTNSQDYLNSTPWLDDPDWLEKAFGTMESRVAPLLRELRDQDSLVGFRDGIRLREYVAALIVRNPAYLQDVEASVERELNEAVKMEVFSQLTALGERTGRSFSKEEFEQHFSALNLKDFGQPGTVDAEGEWNFLALETIRTDLPEIFHWLDRMNWIVYESAADEPPFLLTNPPVIWPILRSGEGVTLLVSISPRILLALAEAQPEDIFDRLESAQIPALQAAKSKEYVYASERFDSLNKLLNVQRPEPE